MITKRNYTIIFVLFSVIILILGGCTPPIPISGIQNIDTGVDYDTIQEAIDAAEDGETVIVYPGTYEENIEFDERNITVQSSDPLDPAIVAATIIDGGGSGSVVRFINGDTSTLEGFTIQNGDAENGGGIYVEDSSSTIENNTITNNNATTFGGGIEVDNSSPLIIGNTITGNTAGENGGGIEIYNSSPNITGNIIEDNTAENGGGGIAMYDSSPTITSNTISNNMSEYGGGISVKGTSLPTIGGIDIADTDYFNTICSNSPDQILPDNYPNNYISTTCMLEF